MSGSLGLHVARFYELRPASGADEAANTLDARDPLLRRLYPNADANILFEIGATDGSGGSFPHRSLGIGSFAEPVSVSFDSSTHVFGIAFLVGRAQAFFGRSAVSMSGRAVPLDAIWCRQAIRELEHELERASSFDERAALVEDALARRQHDNRPADSELDGIVEHVRTTTSVRVSELAASAGLTRQHFTRWFRQAVGIGPKRFALICRLERLLDVIERGPIESWSRTATSLGWYDQAHMITDFRWMTGLSPERFRQERHGDQRE